MYLKQVRPMIFDIALPAAKQIHKMLNREG